MHFTLYLGDSSRIGLNLQFNSDVKSGLISVCPQIIIQSDHWQFQIFSKFIGADWSLIYEDHFHH